MRGIGLTKAIHSYMKLFNTLQELWDYSLYCPICQNNFREIDMEVGPDTDMRLDSYSKSSDMLEIQASFISRRVQRSIKFNVNCVSNDFKSSTDYSSSPYFYFYICADCKKCNASWTNGADIEFNWLDNKIHNIGLERECIHLLEYEKKYQILFDYSQNLLCIEKCTISDKGTPIFIPGTPGFTVPLIDLDFTNQDKLYNKIRTILTFS